MNNIGIIFIHGAGLNSSVWAELKTEINSPILAIDFPNRNASNNSNENLSFDDYINPVVERIKHWGKDNFIIVAHSIGACIGLKVAQQFNKELRGFVAISSVIPTNGESFVSSLPFPQNTVMPLILKLFGTKPPKKSIEAEYCNDLTSEQTHKIVNEFTPEAKALYTTKINFVLPNTPRFFIRLTNDKSLPITLQEKMADNLKADKAINIDSGHLPMLSKPKQLAEVLTNFINNI